MNKVGVIICSFNGCVDTIKCIKSLLKQSWRDFDIYVVDNASEDGTYKSITEMFAAKVKVLCMQENLGGAGGFGAGIDYAVSLGYEYIALMDNDIILDEKAMENMFDCLISDDGLGAVGAKIMWMSQPEVIFDFTDVIDFDKQTLFSPYRNLCDNERLQGAKETDFVPATAGIFRTKALLEAGSMPKDNFIYYDDVELGWNMYRKGWRMVCCGSAKVWHKSSNANRKHDNFSTYYFKRNIWNFTAKYIAEYKVEGFVDNLLEKTFPVLYGCALKEQWPKFETTFYAFDDFARHVRGKAKAGRIQPFSVGNWKVNQAMVSLYAARYSRVRVVIESDADNGQRLLEILHNLWRGVKSIQFAVLSHKQLEGLEHVPLEQEVISCNSDLTECNPMVGTFVSDITIHYCGHVKDQRECVLPDVYIDSHDNVINDERSWEYYQKYDEVFEMFRDMYRPMILSMIGELRRTIP